MLLVIVGALSYFLLISPAATDRDGLRQQNEVLRARSSRRGRTRPTSVRSAPRRKHSASAWRRPRSALPSEREIRVSIDRLGSGLAGGAGGRLVPTQESRGQDVLTEVPIAVTVEVQLQPAGHISSRSWDSCRVSSPLNEFKFTGIERPTGTVRAEMTLATVCVPRPRALRRRPSPARRLPFPLPRRRRPRASRARPMRRHHRSVPLLIASLSCRLWRGRGAPRGPSGRRPLRPGRRSSRPWRFRGTGRERRQAEGPGGGSATPPHRLRLQGASRSIRARLTRRREQGHHSHAAKLVGIVQGRPGLMALVEGPDGIGYILKPGDALGNGRVTAIHSCVVTFASRPSPARVRPR